MPIIIPDFSHYNTIADFAALAAAAPALIHKCTEGLGGADGRFAERRASAGAWGLLFGVYHFGREASGAAQAAHFLATANPLPADRLALDWELPAKARDGSQPPPMTRADAEAFVVAVHEQTGRWPMLYSGEAFLKAQNVPADSPLAACPLWLARYGATPTAPAAWSGAWTLWQFTDRGTLPGVAGPCDLSRFDGDAAALAAFWTGQP